MYVANVLFGCHFLVDHPNHDQREHVQDHSKASPYESYDYGLQRNMHQLHAFLSRYKGRVDHPFFFVDERSQLDDTTPVRLHRVTGLAFQGARPFALLEGSGG